MSELLIGGPDRLSVETELLRGNGRVASGVNQSTGFEERRHGALLLTHSVLENGDQVLALSGELDGAGVEALVVELAKTEIAGDAALTLDLAELSFIDSIGLSLLVSLFRRYNGEGHHLRLVASRAPGVKQVMAVTGLDRTLPFAPPDAG